MRRLLLVDGTALYVRSSRPGQRTGMNAGGIPTGTLTLFTHSLARLLRASRPTHVLAAFDGPAARAWRQGLFPGYKAGRADPPPYYSTAHRLVFDLCEAAGIAEAAYPGYEADDVIAWACRRYHETDAEIVIASDDADLHQLLAPGVTQVPLSAGGQVMDYSAVFSRYGCEPSRLPYLKALAGDPSDGIPGVPGTGPARALRLLREHSWSLSAVAETMDYGQARLIGTYYDILDLVQPLRAIDYEREMDQFPFLDYTEWSSAKATGAAVFFADMKMIKTLSKLKEGSLW